MTIAFDSTTESGFLQSDFNQIAAYLSNADDTTTLETRLDGVDTTVSNLTTTVTNNKTLAEKDTGLLGEVRQFALSISGAVTKATLQGKGWAICDGTTPASQGISSPTITTTPNLRSRFLRHSADETTGGTGGSNSVNLQHNHQWYYVDHVAPNDGSYIDATDTATANRVKSYDSTGTLEVLEEGATKLVNNHYTSNGLSATQDNQPAYYDICYFIKVKV